MEVQAPGKRPRELLQHLQDIQTNLRELGDLARELLNLDLSVKDQVEIGQVLWHLSALIQRMLNPYKETLREEALERAGGRSGTQFIHGRHKTSRCTVNIPQPKIILREDVDDIKLRELLGDQFDRFFWVQSKVMPRPDFSEQATGNPEFVAQLAKIVDTVTDTPRVSFTKG